MAAEPPLLPALAGLGSPAPAPVAITLPHHGIEAYRATLRTMAAIEGGGSGDDDGDFRQLVTGITKIARRNAEGRRLAGAIAAAIARLESAEQIILHLSLVDDCSLAEIGSILDLPPADIARARRIAIGRLRLDLAVDRPG